MSKLKLSKKKILYLDQFAVSDMLESSDESVWGKIKHRLIELHKQEKIFCPLSTEHYFETSQKSYDSAKLHDLFLTKLSDGFCYKPEVFITSQLISSRIRNNRITLKTYMYENVGNNFESKIKYEMFYNQNKRLQSLVTEGAAGINQLRQATNTQKIIPETKKALINVMKATTHRKFIDRLVTLNKNNTLIVKNDIFGTEKIPNWIDQIISELINKHKLSKKEIDKLIMEIETFGFDNIPTLDVKFTLMTLMSVYSKSEKPGDHVDLMRISNGLPISDFFFTDKKRKSEILESKIHEKYNTKIYSGTLDDLNRFLDDISAI